MNVNFLRLVGILNLLSRVCVSLSVRQFILELSMRFCAIRSNDKYCLFNLLSLWLLYRRFYEVGIVFKGSTESLTTTESFFHNLTGTIEFLLAL